MTFLQKTFKGFIWNHFSKLSDYALTYLFSIIVARSLGAAEYGVYVTVMSVAGFTLIAGSVGLDETLNKYIAQLTAAGHAGKLRFVVRRLLSLRAAILLVLCGGLFVMRDQLGHALHNALLAQYVLLIVLYVFSQSITNFIANVFVGQLQTKPVFFLSLAAKLMNLGIGVALLSAGYGLFAIFLLFSVVSAGLLIAYVIAGRNFLSGEREMCDTSSLLRFGGVSWLNSLLALALGRYSTILLLGYFLGTSAQSGYFDIAFSLTLLIEYVFSTGFMGVALSIFSELALTDRTKLSSGRAAIIKYQQAFILPVSIFCLAFPDAVIRLVFSDQYVPAAELLRYFIAFNMVIVSGLGSGSNLAILFALGKEKLVLANRATMGILNLVLNLQLIPVYGAEGAIIATGASMLLANAVEFVMVSKCIGWKYDVKFGLKVCLVSTIALGCVWAIPSVPTGTIFIRGGVFVVLVAGGYALVRLTDLTPKQIMKSLGIVS